MKGRRILPVLSRRKAEKQRFWRIGQMDHFEEIRHWARERTPATAPNSSIYRRIFLSGESTPIEICLGQKCPDFEPCFITRMRTRAEDDDIIIVNHIFSLRLEFRGTNTGAFCRIIPLWFDEAHLIEDIAADISVSDFNFSDWRVVRDAENLPITDAIVVRDLRSYCAIPDFQPILDAVRFRDAGRTGDFAFAERFRAKNDERWIQRRRSASVFRARYCARTAESGMTFKRKKWPKPKSGQARQAIAFRSWFRLLAGWKNYVYWLERAQRNVSARLAIDVSTLCRKNFLTSRNRRNDFGDFKTNGKLISLKTGLVWTRRKPTRCLRRPHSIIKNGDIYLPKAMPNRARRNLHK